MKLIIKGESARKAIDEIKSAMVSKIKRSPAEYIELMIRWHFGTIVVDKGLEKVRWNAPTIASGNWNPDGSDRSRRLESLKAKLNIELEQINDNPLGFFSGTGLRSFITGLTNFKGSAVRLDSGKDGEYWSKPIEMFARATEAFLVKKLTDAGMRNTYLVNDDFVSAADTDIYKASPFPKDEELDLFNSMLEKLWASIEWKADGPVINDAVDFSEEDNSINSSACSTIFPRYSSNCVFVKVLL